MLLLRMVCDISRDMFIDDDLLNRVRESACQSDRLRMHYDLRNTTTDQSQRMLNVLEVGTILPIHRHHTSSETVVLLRGHIIERFYNDEGAIIELYDLNPHEGRYGVQVPMHVWHNFEVLESSAIFEAKDGPYSPCEEADIMSLK